MTLNIPSKPEIPYFPELALRWSLAPHNILVGIKPQKTGTVTGAHHFPAAPREIKLSDSEISRSLGLFKDNVPT